MIFVKRGLNLSIKREKLKGKQKKIINKINEI